jgi:hypothetical protein
LRASSGEFWCWYTTVHRRSSSVRLMGFGEVGDGMRDVVVATAVVVRRQWKRGRRRQGGMRFVAQRIGGLVNR